MAFESVASIGPRSCPDSSCGMSGTSIEEGDIRTASKRYRSWRDRSRRIRPPPASPTSSGRSSEVPPRPAGLRAGMEHATEHSFESAGGARSHGQRGARGVRRTFREHLSDLRTAAYRTERARLLREEARKRALRF